jgi:hypothetical protein
VWRGVDNAFELAVENLSTLSPTRRTEIEAAAQEIAPHVAMVQHEILGKLHTVGFHNVFLEVLGSHDEPRNESASSTLNPNTLASTGSPLVVGIPETKVEPETTNVTRSTSNVFLAQRDHVVRSRDRQAPRLC